MHHMSLSHPNLGLLYIFSYFSLPRPPCPVIPLPSQQCLPLTSNSFVLNLRFWDKESIGVGKWYGITFHDLDSRSQQWHWLRKKFDSLHDKVKNTYSVTTKPASYISLLMLSTWSDFKQNQYIFSQNFRYVFFKVKKTIGYISGMADRIDTEKWSTSVGCWVNIRPWSLTSPLTLTWNFSRSNFKVAVSQALLVWLMWS